MDSTYLAVVSNLAIAIGLILVLAVSVFIFSRTAREISAVWIVEFVFKKAVEKFFESSRVKLLSPVKEAKSGSVQREKRGELVVLEMGVGSGRNFKFYPPGTKLICVDPNKHFRKYFEENKDEFPTVEMERFINAGAEDIDEVEDESVDVVVSTHVLCSVTDLDKVIHQVKRVLRKGGKYYYADHVGAPGGPLFWMQTLVELPWRLVAGNCHLTRNIARVMSEAGFSSVQQESIALPELGSLVKYHTLGVATK